MSTPSDADVSRTIASIQAFAEIMNIPPAQTAIILAKAKKEMGR